MSVSLTAAQCPPLQYRSALLSVANATSTATATVSDSFATGDTTAVAQKQRRNAARADNQGAFGGGAAYYIGLGLALSTSGGLNVTVAPGLALIDGPVLVEAATAVPGVTDNTARLWIWLLQTGVLTTATSLTPPATPCCLLGSVVTGGGAVTQLDTSGVLRYGGLLYRQTADTGKPTDTPPSALRLLTECQNGNEYFWTGTKYLTWPTS